MFLCQKAQYGGCSIRSVGWKVILDITGGWKRGSNAEGDSVWRMHGCTHPHFREYEIVNVYAGATGNTCVETASLLGMRDMEKRGRGAGRVDEIEIPNSRWLIVG